jgi:hypothetical protein
MERSVGGLHGFVFDGATFTAIDVLSATRFTQPSGINDNGQMVEFFGDDEEDL